MTIRFLGAVFAVSLLSSQAMADDCSAQSRPETTPTERFTINADGTVIDKHTGLMWMSCSVGQTWDGKTCTGNAETFSWVETNSAKDELNKANYAGHGDWRVPMVPELASIVELQCFNPRVNVKVFPATASDLYWSSMEKKGTTDRAYTLNFGEGEATPTNKSKDGALRLVRGGPWWTPPKMMMQ